MSKLKRPVIRTLDIETFPNIAHVWGIWQQNVGLNQIIQEDQIAAFAYKDLGDDTTYYMDLRQGSEKVLVKAMRDILDSTDIVIGHNFKRFDDKWIIGRCIRYGLKPPSPYKIVDTLLESRKLMKLTSYRLDHVAKVLKCSPKSAHGKYPGHALWLACMQNVEEAWNEMEDYNRQDVSTNEEVYLKLRPYIRNHPNVGVFGKRDVPVCPKCGSTHIHFRGHYFTNTGKYRKFQCQEVGCHAWGRLRASVIRKQQRKGLATNA